VPALNSTSSPADTHRKQLGDTSVALVNLIDKAGPARALGTMMSSALLNLGGKVASSAEAEDEGPGDRSGCTEERYRVPLFGRRTADELGVSHLWFDQHYAIARLGSVDAMKALYQKLRPFILEPNCSASTGPYSLGNYLQIDHAGNVVRLQLRLIRTNCIDCLDRTNFAQVNALMQE
jgi:hypothetical protein